MLRHRINEQKNIIEMQAAVHLFPEEATLLIKGVEHKRQSDSNSSEENYSSDIKVR